MREYPKLNAKERQLMARQQAEVAKKPYMVKGLPKTVLYLSDEQATKRLDLIPQFGR
ncbi:hypothetical protein [Spirosoma gilvum]